jgi:hypothetical protein
VSQFEYVAVLISIIVGLALTQILRGVGRMVTTKDGPRPYWVHLVWTFYFFLYITMFWWWEFQLDTVDWSLLLYLVVIIYATLLFFVGLVIQPSTIDQITSYKEYYYSHRRWIFSLLIAISLWDFVDTLSKGSNHFLDLGIEHRVGNVLNITAAAVAIITPNERYHEIYAVAWLLYFVTFMYRNFFVLI